MVKKRGLGKPLDALLVGSFTANIENNDLSQQTDTYRQLPVNIIQRGKYQPRRAMDPVALDELSKSIRSQGIIQPIVVRPLQNGRFEIIAGERRWRAAQLAELTEVPAIIKEIPDEAAVAIALIENIQRESLNPIEEAFALQRLLDEFSMTHQQVAESVGKSRTTVTNLLRLLALDDSVKNMVEEGKLEMGHARALLTLSDTLQIEAARAIISKGLSVRETEALVRQMQLPDTLTATPRTIKPIDPDIRKLQHDLSQRIRLPVSIMCGNKGKGKLVIQYKNLTELDLLLEYFS